MKLLKLTLSNFKGVKSFILEPGGQDATVYGANGTGKSTLADSLLWLLFDKGQDFKSLTVKTLDDSGAELHGLDHSVEGSFLLDDGKTLTLKKTLSETYTKKRGTADKVFTGHSTDYWVDEVPLKLKEYNAQINSLVPDIEIFKLLSSPFYFASVLTWQKRRETLLSICGDISDQDVIASDPELARLTELLSNHSIEDLKKIIAGQLSKLNKEIQEIPVRIDEASLLLPDLTGLDLQALKKQRASINKEIKALTEQLQGLRADNGASNLRQKIAEGDLLLRQIETRDKAAHQENIFLLRGKIQSFREDRDKIKYLVTDRDLNLSAHSKNSAEMVLLREEFTSLKAQEFLVDKGELCPTCEQVLPAERQETTFNLWRSDKLSEIQTKGKNLSALNRGLQEQIERQADKPTEMGAKELEIKGFSDKLKTLKDSATPCSDEYLKKEAEVALLEERLKEASTSISDSANRDGLSEKKGELKDALEGIKDQIDKFTTAKDIRARVKALGLEERSLAGQYERVEAQKFLVESFVRAKVEMLEGRIIEKLGMPGLSVKMFAEQINGGLTETCSFIYNGVPFGEGLNKSQEIRVGLALIDMLGKHYEISLPCMIDNYECCTHVQTTDFQLIKLVVSGADETLRVEIEG